MSITNSITKLLNIKDKNLNFNENFLEERKIKGKRCLVIKGYLSNSFEYCPKCGCVNDNSIIKKGTKICMIKINKISELTSYLELTKQMYKCKNCNKRFISTSNIVDFRCRISNNVKIAIYNCAKEMLSKKLISRLYNVCDNTVQRIFDTMFNNEKVYKNSIPEAICIDEFTYKNKTMAFNICDATTGKTVDLIEDRSTHNLDKYFSHYLKEARLRVKFVIMDMYKPYVGLIKKWFPNALIIIDLFHIVQLISRSLNKTRINTMKDNKEDKNKFKKYWRLILKSRFDVDGGSWKKFRCFKNLMTEIDVVDYLLNKDKILSNTYDMYQDLLYYLQRRDYDSFDKVLKEQNSSISKYMKTSINSLIYFSEYIKNTLEYEYNNGVMERNNNTCKLIKRISYGFRNFKNMKSRILIITNVFRKKKRKYYTKYSTPKYV